MRDLVSECVGGWAVSVSDVVSECVSGAVCVSEMVCECVVVIWSLRSRSKCTFADSAVLWSLLVDKT